LAIKFRHIGRLKIRKMEKARGEKMGGGGKRKKLSQRGCPAGEISSGRRKRKKKAGYRVSKSGKGSFQEKRILPKGKKNHPTKGEENDIPEKSIDIELTAEGGNSQSGRVKEMERESGVREGLAGKKEGDQLWKREKNPGDH